MSTPVKVITGLVVLGGLIYVGRLVYIKYAYPSHDRAKASDIKPAGTPEVSVPSY